MGTLSPPSSKTTLPAEALLETLSYSHFEPLAAIDDPLKRVFYEAESVRGTWSVRELKRQIASLYFERSGLSRNKKKLAAISFCYRDRDNEAQLASGVVMSVVTSAGVKRFLDFRLPGIRLKTRQ